VFCEIVARRVDGHEVVRADGVVAFLDRSPLFIGHLLVVPEEHCETLADLPPEDLRGFFEVVQRLQSTVMSALGAQGAFVAMNNVVSQSVPHLHCHVVPRTKGDGLKGFFWPRTRYRDELHLSETAARLAAGYQMLAGGP